MNTLSSLPWWGFALLSAFFAALTTIFAKLGVEGVDSNLATAIRTLVILVIAWGIVAATGDIRSLGHISPRIWFWLILSAVATGLSWLSYFKALQMGNASFVAPIDKSSLAMILVLSVLFLHEPLTWKSALGTVTILAGTLLFIL
jgi:transporter family protein